MEQDDRHLGKYAVVVSVDRAGRDGLRVSFDNAKTRNTQNVLEGWAYHTFVTFAEVNEGKILGESDFTDRELRNLGVLLVTELKLALKRERAERSE